METLFEIVANLIGKKYPREKILEPGNNFVHFHKIHLEWTNKYLMIVALNGEHPHQTD